MSSFAELEKKCLSDIKEFYDNNLNSDDAARAVVNNFMESSLFTQIEVHYGSYKEPFIFLINGRSALFTKIVTDYGSELFNFLFLF